MSTVSVEPDTAIRKIAGADYRHVRLLPVQLTQLPASALRLKQLRMMSIVPDHELIVRGKHRRHYGFAVEILPDHDKPIRFLMIKYFAVDALALFAGSAVEIEQYAESFALTTGCKGIMVRANGLIAATLKFYRERGYILDGDALIRK